MEILLDFLKLGFFMLDFYNLRGGEFLRVFKIWG
jgi:hypothetical protein